MGVCVHFEQAWLKAENLKAIKYLESQLRELIAKAEKAVDEAWERFKP